MKSFIKPEDGSNLTDISPILTCIHTLSESSALWEDDRSKYFKSLSLDQLKGEKGVSKEDGFLFAVSLRDGSCLYTSEAISNHLGYPKDMLVGQCIMNFLFHKDHITFANHLTQGLNACFIQGKRDNSHLVLNTFFCRLRIYQGLKFGYSISEQKTTYKPFKITLHINELIVDDMCVEKASGTLCVKATATHVSSAYSIPEEIPAMSSFSTRHTASCHFSHVDASAIPYLGYLPQDMIGYSVFEFYHIDDMPQLKDIYELVVKEQGSSFRSKPYRFKVQNGCFILLETEWSCFINPWSHKLEFVVGQHRVLKGPTDIDIFAASELEEVPQPEEIVKESQVIQKEIKTLLSQSIQTFEAKKSKRFCNKRKRDLAAFVYNCIDETFKESTHKSTGDKQDLMDDRSHSDPDSVVMGDISPYREVNDSSWSSETPPTVQQLRYQENIERFFASQPKTYSDGSEEYNKNEKLSNVEDSQGSSSGSGKGSGKASASNSKGQQSSQSPSQNYETDNQKSGSNSSKCNMSSFTTGDSGYGKSMEKSTTNDPCTSQAGSSNQMWAKPDQGVVDSNVGKFSSCLALTEESLSVHNKINNKHSKQQRKGKTGTTTVALKDNNWYQKKEQGHSKHLKISQSHALTASTPTQTEEVVVNTATVETPSKPEFPPTSNQKTVPELPENPTSKPSVTSTFPYPQGSCIPTPTPFYIPVMYMGGMPFYPPGPNGPSQWPFGPVPFAFPPSQCDPQAPPTFQFPFNLTGGPPQSASSFPVYTSGPATSVSTKSTTVISNTVSSFKNSTSGSKQSPPRKVAHISRSKESNKEVKSDPNESDMNVDESQSSFTRSSSYQSGDKDDGMDLEDKKIYVGAALDKVELDSEIAYRYQMNVTNIEDVLKKDREFLQSMQQPELVNKQLLLLQEEREDQNDNKMNPEGEDYCMTEEVMLGLASEDDVNEELEYREECLLQLMCDDFTNP